MICSVDGDRIEVLAPAKVNLFLEVCGRRPDGFHEIDTVFQAVTLYDRLTVTPAADVSLAVTGACADVPADGRNHVVRAAEALRARVGATAGAHVALEKGIPAGGGLGGGSSDAAATLVALNRLWDAELNCDDLLALAGGLGSDVAFFIRGATAHGRGRGERLDPIVTALVLWYVILWPGVPTSTAEAYRRLDARACDGARSPDALIDALLADDPAGVGAAAFNRFEEILPDLNPTVARSLTHVRETGPPAAHLAGSGSAVFGIFDREDRAEAAANHLRTVTDGSVWVARTETQNT